MMNFDDVCELNVTAKPYRLALVGNKYMQETFQKWLKTANKNYYPELIYIIKGTPPKLKEVL